MQRFIIKAQDGLLLDKHLHWVDAGDRAQLFATPHRDIALNQLIELNTKDIHLRAAVIACDSDERGNPVVECQPACATD